MTNNQLNLCQTCQHWRQEYDVNDADELIYLDWGNCSLTEKNNFDHLHPDSLALAEDAENYYAILTTNKNFGCVQWSEKL